MRQTLFWAMLVWVMASSCNWNSEHTSEQVSLSFETRAGESTEIVNRLKLLLFGENGKLGDVISLSDAQREASLAELNLMPGAYELWAVANSLDANLTASVGSTPAEVLLKLAKLGDAYSGNVDLLTGKSSFVVESGGVNSASVQLERRVAKLNVSISDIPSDVDSIYIQVSGTPVSVNLTGSKLGTKSTVEASMRYDRTMQKALGEVLLFPAESGAVVNILYERDKIVRKGSLSILQPLKANSSVSVAAKFGVTEKFQLSFAAPVWGEDVVVNEDFSFSGNEEIVADNRPVDGTPTSSNLLLNGGFETWGATALPDNWAFQVCADSSVSKITSPIMNGVQGIRLNGKTYISQDVAVTARKAYQLKLFARCDSENFKWKCCCAWYKTPSTMVGASFNDAIQTAEYQGQTEGWVDIFNSSFFRAPVGAAILRIEFRCYSDKEDGTGLCLDALEVHEIEEIE